MENQKSKYDVFLEDLKPIIEKYPEHEAEIKGVLIDSNENPNDTSKRFKKITTFNLRADIAKEVIEVFNRVYGWNE